MIIQGKIFTLLTLTTLLLTLPQGPLFADYAVTLKSGRKITVKSYRVESSHTRLYTVEGEIVFPKEQIIEIQPISTPTPQKAKEKPLLPQKTKEEPLLPQPKKSPLYLPEEKPSEAQQKEAPDPDKR